MTGRSVVFAGLVLLAACSSQPAATGAEVAAEVGCLSCHMDTDNDLAPTLNGIFGATVVLDDGTTTMVDDEYVRTSIVEPELQIVEGYGDSRMPPFSLSDEEVDQLVEYVRSLS